MPRSKAKSPEELVNEMFREPDPLMLSDREIHKQTGIWKRAEQQIGVPLPSETRAKISVALSGRSLSTETKAKISESLKGWHSRRKAT